MEFTVPQFIEKEPKIVGPFTFKQFIFIGIAGGVSIFLYFVLPLALFIIVAAILLGSAFALAFLKINRTPLPIFIKNLFLFSFKPKVYLWHKKTIQIKILPKELAIEKEDFEDESIVRIPGKSHLRKLFTRLETKHR